MDATTLADRQVIAPWQPHFLRQVLDEKFLELGVTFTPRLQMDSMRCMIEMAQRGDGIVILPPSCVVRELSEGRLMPVQIDSSFKLFTNIGKAPGRQNSQVNGLMIQELLSIAADLAPRLGWTVSDAAAT